MTHSPLRPGSVASLAAATLLALAWGTASVDIRDFSPDGNLILYAIRDGGRDEVSIRVRDGVDYPAIVVVQGNLDTRVPPLQARKVAAGMQLGVRAEGGWRC